MSELPDDLRRALAELDARATRASAGVDPARVAQRVLGRLRSEPLSRPAPARWRTVLRIAAAVAVLAAGTVLVRTWTQGPRGPVTALPVYLSDSLAMVQADAVMEDVAAATDSVVVTSAALTVDDLTEPELQALLQDMQSDMEGAL